MPSEPLRVQAIAVAALWKCLAGPGSRCSPVPPRANYLLRILPPHLTAEYAAARDAAIAQSLAALFEYGAEVPSTPQKLDLHRGSGVLALANALAHLRRLYLGFDTPDWAAICTGLPAAPAPPDGGETSRDPCACSCRGDLDPLGDHVACACREAAVARHARLADMNFQVPVSKEWRIEVVANGLPLWHGSQLALDCRRPAQLRPSAIVAWAPGLRCIAPRVAACHRARRRTLPELHEVLAESR
ncbi:unnamed protein product [Symbiodinium microadriaticum]|nr:unnamed protein product [Symbiodinium microadriaticum]